MNGDYYYANIYKEDMRKIAEMLSQLSDMKDRWEAYMEDTSDNGDPYFDSQAVIESMGKLLSSLVIYQQEYEVDLSAIPAEEPKKGERK